MDPLLSQRRKHLLLQRLLWNRYGEILVKRYAALELRVNTIVRNYSLIGMTNGERWLLTLVKDTPVVLDVGFNEGQSTVEVLRARPRAQVHAFDPAQSALSTYSREFASDSRITFNAVALSDAAGTVVFYDYDNQCNSLAVRREGDPGARREYQVAVMTLDQYAESAGVTHIDLLKIDAEGYDLHVLEGSRVLLDRQAIDIFMFEFGSGWAASRRYLWEFAEAMKGLDYELYRLFNGFLVPFEYDIRLDSCTTLPAMYVGVSHDRLEKGDIPVRQLRV